MPLRLLSNTEKYIKDNSLDTTPEEMFLNFQKVYKIHMEFEAYLNKSGFTYKLNTMQRNKRLLEKRRIFIQWYIAKNQSNKMMKEMKLELSEIIFITTRTVEKSFSHETTELTK